jgi:hypothetical protein
MNLGVQVLVATPGRLNDLIQVHAARLNKVIILILIIFIININIMIIIYVYVYVYIYIYITIITIMAIISITTSAPRGCTRWGCGALVQGGGTWSWTRRIACSTWASSLHPKP